MNYELEDVVVIDRSAGKLYNFSDIVPDGLKKEEIIIDEPQAFLSSGQEILGIEYTNENEYQSLSSEMVKNGGHYWPDIRGKKRSYLKSLPPFRYQQED